MFARADAREGRRRRRSRRGRGRRGGIGRGSEREASDELGIARLAVGDASAQGDGASFGGAATSEVAGRT